MLRRQAATLVDHADGTCIDVPNGRHLRVCAYWVTRAPTHIKTLSVCGSNYFTSLSFYKAMVSLANATYCLAIRTVPCTIVLREPIRLHPDQLLLPAGGSRQCVLVFKSSFRAHLLHILNFIKKIPFSRRRLEKKKQAIRTRRL